ncbi:MAG TPA: flagellar GTP-binding protein [Opitutaceae bacterium]|nr:flagellar GTP-binding protein [Opitutaceae bacterium]
MSSPASQVSGACYKFTVRSADEAATLIRERLGPQARVLSVRTVESGGLARLWAAPRLEVVAQIDPSLPVPPEAAALPAAFVPPPPLPIEQPAPELPRLAPRAPRSLAALLRRTGLSELALGRLQSSPGWDSLQALPLHRALAEAGARLRLEADRPAGRPLTRAAFLGAPGVGRTTALCKWLGMEVFRRGRLGHVVSVEFDRPNPPGPLPVFCEALGVPVARFPASTRPAVPGGFVYFDLPGLSTRDPGENKALADFLAREQIDQRVLVLNAAYDHAALRTAYAAGRALGATHLVFTHLDEVPQWGRLWDYLIDGALEPVFFATGPSLTGDCEEDVSSALVRRTLVPADEAETETEAPAYAIR